MRDGGTGFNHNFKNMIYPKFQKYFNVYLKGSCPEKKEGERERDPSSAASLSK